MVDNKNLEHPLKQRRKRRKTENQLKLEKLKEILKKGLDVHKKAIDKVIHDYTEYIKYDELIKERDKLEARIKAVDEMKQQSKS